MAQDVGPADSLPHSVTSRVARGLSPARERALIDAIRSRIGAAPPWLLVGPGDDAAVAEAARGELEVLTTDCLVEGVHFDLDAGTLGDVGFKALAVNVSDIAAMGAAPRLALLSLLLPDAVTQGEALRIVDGVLESAALLRVVLAGGNISRTTGPLVVSMTVLGTVGRRKVLRRAGARPGDAIFVSGWVGQAAAGLAWLQAGKHVGQDFSPADSVAQDFSPAILRHLRPEPRLRLGLMLGRNRVATACMDTSDGFADAVAQVAVASGVGARIDAAALPFRRETREWLMSRGLDPVQVAAASDDYELLFTVPPKRARRLDAARRIISAVPVTRIGIVTPEPALVLLRDGREEDLPSGYTHDLHGTGNRDRDAPSGATKQQERDR